MTSTWSELRGQGRNSIFNSIPSLVNPELPLMKFSPQFQTAARRTNLEKGKFFVHTTKVEPAKFNISQSQPVVILHYMSQNVTKCPLNHFCRDFITYETMRVRLHYRDNQLLISVNMSDCLSQMSQHLYQSIMCLKRCGNSQSASSVPVVIVRLYSVL